MNILVYANCQLHQLVMALSLMLMEKAQIVGIDINNPGASQQLKELADRGHASEIDCVLTNHGTDELASVFDRRKIISIPTIHFGGFHPDVVYFASTQAPSKPLFFRKNPTISALTLWGYLNRLSVDDAFSLYREDVFEALGYMDFFDVCCHAILENFAEHSIDIALIERFIASRQVFMYGPLHPRFEVTLSLCEGICELINLTPKFSFDEINCMIPDPLQHEYAWGCFPPLAARLGVPGSWMIRHYNEIFPTIPNYIQAVYTFLDSMPKGSIQFLERDKDRFNEFHKINDVLRRFT